MTDELAARVKTVQIIIGALTMGAIAFLGVAVFIQVSKPTELQGTPMLTYVLLGAAAMTALGARTVVLTAVSGALRTRLADKPPADLRPEILAGWMTHKIIGAALVEGPAFLAIVAYLIEGQIVAAALGGVAIAGIAMQLPSESSARGWVEDMERAVRG